MMTSSRQGGPALVGGCLCGNVRYAISTLPAVVAICHCRNCQKQGGAAFSVNLAVPPSDLQVKGELSVFIDRADSGAQVHRQFCRSCGSPVFSEIPSRPAHVFVKAGTLDDTSGIRPTLQAWCASAQPWVSLDQDLVSFDRQPGA